MQGIYGKFPQREELLRTAGTTVDKIPGEEQACLAVIARPSPEIRATLGSYSAELTKALGGRASTYESEKIQITVCAGVTYPFFVLDGSPEQEKLIDHFYEVAQKTACRMGSAMQECRVRFDRILFGQDGAMAPGYPNECHHHMLAIAQEEARARLEGGFSVGRPMYDRANFRRDSC
jgi:hypothetical protein